MPDDAHDDVHPQLAERNDERDLRGAVTKGARPDWAREMTVLTILGWIVVLTLILPAVIPAALAGKPFLNWQILVTFILVGFGTWKTKPWRLTKRAKSKR